MVMKREPNMSPRAVIFGAGKVGCGLLGRLLFQSGYQNLFVARRPEVIDAIQRNNGYTVNLLNGGVHRVAVKNCSALSIENESAVIEAVSGADIVFTAVGIDNLAAIAPLIAEGLWQRSRAGNTRPLNIVACENLPGAGAYLRHQILSATAADRAMVVDSVGGFSAAITRQIMTGGDVENGKISLSAEGESDLIIDANGLRPSLPQLHGAKFTTEFSAMVKRKLFTLNCAHAVAAYLGYREGCQFMHEAAVHPRVAPVLMGAVAEAQAALKTEFPDHARVIEEEVAESLKQIADPRLADPISRVARGPRRKLSPRERLVGPAKLARRHHLPNENLCKAIAAALSYDYSKDPEAVAMQDVISEEGLQAVITEDCGLLPHEELAQRVKYEWHRLRAGNARPDQATDEAAAFIERIVISAVSDLSQKYNPRFVSDMMKRVAERINRASTWSLVPALLKSEASHGPLTVSR
jgi:mannitol-1-phosphate 5-dehydrogenase